MREHAGSGDVIVVKSASRSIDIREIGEDVFSRRYHARCLDCRFCDDLCCSYGCTMDVEESARILVFAQDLESRLSMGPAQWFEGEAVQDAGYRSGWGVRTRVHGGKCAFYDRAARGCVLHRFAVERGMDWRELKPMVCSMFPVAWEEGRLFVSPFLDELPCRDQGLTVYEAQKEELRAYLGDDAGDELEHMSSCLATDVCRRICSIETVHRESVTLCWARPEV